MLDLTDPAPLHPGTAYPAVADHEGRKHALLSASKAHIWARCEAAPTLWQHLPPGPSSRYADEGRKVAEAVEHVGKGLLPALPPAYAAAQPYLDRVASLMADALDPVTMYEPDFLGALLTADNPHRGGTPDAAAVDLTGQAGLHVVDLKWGEGVYVEAEGNEQGLTYLDALDRWATLQRGPLGPLPDSTPASFWIEQPRWRDESDRSRTWAGTLGSFRVLFRKLAAAADRIRRHVDSIVPFEMLPFQEGEHCRFCPVGMAGTCPARDKRMLDALGELDAPRPSTVPSVPVAPIPPELIPAEKLAAALPLFPRIRAWLDAAEARALALAMRSELPGYKAVAGKPGNRAWAGEDTVTAEALAGLRLNPYVRKLVSPAVAEEALAKQPSDRPGKAWGKKDAAALLAKLVSRAPGKPTLAPASDPRPPFDAAASLPALPLDAENPEG